MASVAICSYVATLLVSLWSYRYEIDLASYIYSYTYALILPPDS